MLFFWMIIIVTSLLLYVMLDGYDLGIATLTLFERDAAHRRLMLEVVGNVWDGNETWLIMLAMGLWGGMPEAYATAMPALYIPLVVMIFGLMVRGFAVEMASSRPRAERFWIRNFGIASLVTAFAQGVAFGGLLSGVTVRDGHFAGGAWDFLGNGYALLTGAATVVLYALAGAARMQSKAEGDLRAKMSALTRPLTVATGLAVVASAALLPVATSASLTLVGVDRWLPFGYAVLLAITAFVVVYRRAGRAPDRIPFLAVCVAETAGLVALVALYFPQLVPPSVTLYSAGASRLTLDFLLVITGVLGPLTLAYHGYANWVFRGRHHLRGEPGPESAPARLGTARPAEGGH